MDNVKTKAACNFFITKAQEEGRIITPMQAIKLVYFAHGYSLALLKTPLIDDHVEAWKFGTVIPSLYHKLKIYGSGKIKCQLLNTDDVDIIDFISLSEDELQKKYPNNAIEYKFSDGENAIMSAVWKSYGDKTGFQLSNIIHQEGTPWDTVYNKQGGQFQRNAIIPDKLIQEYYEKRTGKTE